MPLRSFARLFIWKKNNAIPLNKLISSGNIKLPSTTAIFNINSATDCASDKLGLCAAKRFGCKCYAKKAEYFRPHVLRYRRRQTEFWDNTTPEEFVSQFLMLNALKVKPFKNIRINESGDFRGQKDIEKVEKIATMLRRFGIRVYGYTSRKDLDFSKIRHTILSGSGFKKAGISNVFQIIGRHDKVLKGYGLCKGDCGICKRCLQKKGLKTCVRSH